jgi:hypothetical protein
VFFLHFAGNAVDRANACAKGTTDAFFRDNDDLEEFGTYAGRAFLVRNMGHELIFKSLDR